MVNRGIPVQSLQGNNPIYQNPLVAWLVIVMLLGLSLLGASYLLYQKEHAKTTMAAQELAHSHALLTDAILDDLHRIILAATQDYLGDPGPHNREQLTRLLKHRQATNPHIMDLLILDGQGEIAVWTGSGSPPVVRDRAYFQHHLDHTESLSYISPPQLSWVHQDAWFFSLSRAIHNEQGELQAVGVAFISISAMEQNFSSLLDTENLSITLLHQNGQMLLRIPSHGQQTGVDLGAFANIPLPLLAPLTQDYPVGLDGKPRIAYFLPLQDHHLILATSASLEPALLAWRNNSLILASLWLLFALSTLWIARKLARSVRNERATQALYQNLYEHVSDAIFLIEVQEHAPRLRFIGSNPAHARSIGIPNPELQSKTPEQLLNHDTAQRVSNNYARCAREKRSFSYEEVLELPAGKRFWMTILNPVLNAYGQVSLIVGIGRDITERKEAEDHIAHLAHYDALTDLPNRTLFVEMAQRALGAVRREQSKLALMFVDLDRFKPVNDQHGHAIGDLLLQQVAERMQHTLRDADIVARIGGDEFVVLLHRIEHAEDALTAAEKIRHQLSQTFHINQLQLAISCSIGVALYPEHGQELTELSRHADIAMYQAKEAGRNNTQLFHPQMLKDT